MTQQKTTGKFHIQALLLLQFKTSISQPGQGFDDIARLIVTYARRLLHGSDVALELVQRDNLECRDAEGPLAGTRDVRFPAADSLSGHCLGTMRPQRCEVFVADTRTDVRLCAEQGGRSLLAVPVMDRGCPLGILKVASSKSGAFDEEAFQLAELIAGISGLAIGQLLAHKTAIALEGRYRILFESAKDGILMLDPGDGRITDANPFLLKMLSYSREELLEKHLWEIGLLRHADAGRSAFRELLEKGYLRIEDLSLETRAGHQIEVELIGSVYRVGEDNFIQCILRDITDRKRAEAEVSRLKTVLEDRVETRTAELKAANQELEAFSYSISHDLRAPLRAIVGFSRILATDHAAQLSPAILRYLEMIRTNANQMGELIDDLLAFSRLSRQPLTRQRIDIAAMVRRVAEDLWPEREGRCVELNVMQLPVCMGDPAMMKQVWVNLISNALKYTRRREAAEITIGCREDIELMPGQKVYFIRDNGVGFDPRYKGKLFGVFQRLHRAEHYEGTGVGLAIAQRIIRRHDGQIWAEAELHRGATFFFTLSGEVANG